VESTEQRWGFESPVGFEVGWALDVPCSHPYGQGRPEVVFRCFALLYFVFPGRVSVISRTLMYNVPTVLRLRYGPSHHRLQHAFTSGARMQKKKQPRWCLHVTGCEFSMVTPFQTLVQNVF